jgi:hypothetical protein
MSYGARLAKKAAATGLVLQEGVFPSSICFTVAQ